jgi:VWFA-related protein
MTGISRTTSLRSCLLLISALATCSGGLLIAQQSTPSPPTTQQAVTSDLVMKSVVRRVILDVVVTDSTGKPVKGLTQSDFSVAEDGVRQSVLSFDVHDFDAPVESIPKLPPLPPNTFVNVPTAPEQGPLYIVLYDMVNTEMSDQGVARQQLVKFINNKAPGARFAIFGLSDRLRLVQGFTSDRNQLLAALDSQGPKPHLPKIFLYSRNYGKGDPVLMLSVVTDIAQYFDGLPGRKNLIWLAGSFPISMVPQEGQATDLLDDIRRALDTMAESQVAIYPVDVRGVSVDNPSMGLAASGLSPAGVGASLLDIDYETERDVATSTGGQAFYSNNDIAGALTDATENGGDYYTLTYAPSNPEYDGQLRNIKVELAKHGYQLAYRSSYYADDPNWQRPANKVSDQAAPPPPPRKIGDSLYANMEHGAPLAHALLFRAHIHALGGPAMATQAQMSNLEDQPAYFRVRHKNRPLKPLAPVRLQTYAIDFTFVVRPPSSDAPARATRPPALEVASAAFDAEGKMLNAMVQNSDPKGSSASGDTHSGDTQGIYRIRQQLDVPLSATSIRVAVRDKSNDHIGAMEVSLPLAPEPQTADNRLPAPAPATPH